MKLRLVSATLAALAVSVAVAGAVAVWHAKDSVRSELNAALAGAERTVGDALQEAEGTLYPDVQINRTVELFNSARHVRVVRLDQNDHVVLASRPLQTIAMAPPWFEALFEPEIPSSTIRIPLSLNGGSMRLMVDAHNELGEVWSGFIDLMLGLIVFMTLGFVLIYRTVALALRPLEQVSTALGRIGDGDYAVAVETGSSAELDPVAEGLNAMAGRLQQVETENLRLQEQLLSLQEEERAEIARDLHDEVGPYLFAVNIDAAAIDGLATDRPAIGERVAMIKQAVGHMQSHVRDMLGRLRPVRLVEFGLKPGLEDLIDFWRSRQPDIEFELRLDFDENSIGLDGREALYRLVQEALSNAMRHARPSTVSVAVRSGPDHLEVLVANDGEPARQGAAASGYGLMGMRERIEGLGGRLDLSADRENGWLVRAKLPRQTSPLEA